MVYRDFSGKQHWLSTGVDVVDSKYKRKETEALDKAKCFMNKKLEEIEAAEQRKLESKNSMYLTGFINQWLDDIKPSIKLSTWETYDKTIKASILPYWTVNNKKIVDLKGADFSKFFNYLKEKGRVDGKGGLGKKSVKNIKGILSSAMKYAAENDLIKSNVVENSRLPLFDNEEFEAVTYSPEQIKTLLDVAKTYNTSICLFINLVAVTGARKGEILGLTWDCVDFENNTIYICQNRVGTRKVIYNQLTTPKTKNGYRTLFIPDHVMDMLHNEKECQNRNKELLKKCYYQGGVNYVIRQQDGKPYSPNSVNRIINKLMDRANLPHCRIHDIRHAVASMLFEMGVPLPEITTQLGHGQTSTTEKLYVHKKNIGNAKNTNALASMIGI